MQTPLDVIVGNLKARIIYAPSDGRFHASWNAGGLRTKVSAKTLSEAESKIREKLKRISSQRVCLSSISQREEAKLASALTILRENGFSDILDVAMDYVGLKKKEAHDSLRIESSNHAGVLFGDAAQQWFKFKKSGWSQVNTRTIESRLTRIKEALIVDVAQVDHVVISDFLDQFRAKKPKTRNHFREILKGVLSFSFDRGWVSADQFERLKRILKNEPAPAGSPQILSPGGFDRLLHAAKGSEIFPIIAIAGFTGARQAEILRLDWGHVWERPHHVELEAHLTKTRRRRLVPRNAALIAWLDQYRNSKGPIWSQSVKSFEAKYYRIREKAGIKGNNLLRHSYASYRFTQIGEDELAKELGNSPEMIFSNYRELVEPSAASQWFNLRP